jgi:hypothetical protein
MREAGYDILESDSYMAVDKPEMTIKYAMGQVTGSLI